MSSNEVYANILTISWNLWLADALEFILENLHICKNTFFLVPHTHTHTCVDLIKSPRQTVLGEMSLQLHTSKSVEMCIYLPYALCSSCSNDYGTLGTTRFFVLILHIFKRDKICCKNYSKFLSINFENCIAQHFFYISTFLCKQHRASWIELTLFAHIKRYKSDCHLNNFPISW